MRLIAPLLAMGFLLFLSVQSATTQTQQPSYCLAANDVIRDMTFATREKMESEIAAVYQRCQPGDIVSLFRLAAGFSQYFCDFSRSVVVRGGDVTCVLAPPRPIRR